MMLPENDDDYNGPTNVYNRDSPTNVYNGDGHKLFYDKYDEAFYDSDGYLERDLHNGDGKPVFYDDDDNSFHDDIIFYGKLNFPDGE